MSRTPIEARIAESGPVTFDRYMAMCLYDPDHGYYSSGGPRSSTTGDFVTSPELDPAFGRLWARGFAGVASALGAQEDFVVAEVGGGEGGFAAAVIPALAEAMGTLPRYVLVEPIPSLRRRQEELLRGVSSGAGISWIDSLEDREPAGAGVVFCNEVLDNLPAAVLRTAGGNLEEASVEAVGGRLRLSFGPVRHEIAELSGRYGLTPPEGVVVEIPPSLPDLIEGISASLLGGTAVFVDYGDETEGLFARPSGTLLSYSSDGVDDRVLDRPGERDITMHANWSLVRSLLEERGWVVSGPLPQGEVLRRLGADEILEELRLEERSASEAGEGRRAVRAVSRRGALSALLSPSGLGGLGVLTASKGMAPPAWSLPER